MNVSKVFLSVFLIKDKDWKPCSGMKFELNVLEGGNKPFESKRVRAADCPINYFVH